MKSATTFFYHFTLAVTIILVSTKSTMGASAETTKRSLRGMNRVLVEREEVEWPAAYAPVTCAGDLLFANRCEARKFGHSVDDCQAYEGWWPAAYKPLVCEGGMLFRNSCEAMSAGYSHDKCRDYDSKFTVE